MNVTKENGEPEVNKKGEQKKKPYCNDFDMQSPRRTHDGHEKASTLWANAHSDDCADKIRKNTGYR
jgi:hypothetical protein